MSKHTLSYDEAIHYFSYDPITGLVAWKNPRTKHAVVGGEVGSASRDGYRRGLMSGYRTFSIHRVAWLMTYGEWPKHEIDHINHVRDDNRLCNLREVTRAEQLRNASLKMANTTGCTGVIWHKRDCIWAARININSRSKHLGNFDDYFEACCARKSANIKYGFHANHGMGTVRLS